MLTGDQRAIEARRRHAGPAPRIHRTGTAIQPLRALLARLGPAAALTLLLGACAFVPELHAPVAVQSMAADEYLAQRRADLLSTGRLSAATMQLMRVTGLDQQACAQPGSPLCIAALAEAEGISDEHRLSALAELWLQRALSMPALTDAGPQRALAVANWMEVARHAYAYLFFTRRTPAERAFQDRQTQVRDWYNYAVQQAVAQVFRARELQAQASANGAGPVLQLGDWVVRIELKARLPGGATLPDELLPASALSFRGLRGTYRRDGFGAELVAVTGDHRAAAAPVPDAAFGTAQPAHGSEPAAAPWSEMPTPNVTAVFRFEVRSLEELLRTREVVIGVHDPLLEQALLLHGVQVPLAANFTAGYGVWLSRSGFGQRSLRGLFGRERGVERPHLYLLQPFDPGRRVILLLHGLASSPEAWINVANEVLGDELLRREFQIWQVYYPTGMPLPASHAAIRQLLEAGLRHFDPQGRTAASRGLVLIGHSMGGMIARLMVSSAEDRLWDWVASDVGVDPALLDRNRSRLEQMLGFEPFPGVERAIFIATPHRGTTVAGHGPARWVSGLIRMPVSVLESVHEVLGDGAAPSGTRGVPIGVHVPTSIDQLDERDPFVRAAAGLPISAQVRYHSIIARRSAAGALADADDGLVPYRSAHLAGADSEQVIVSGHSVQESAAAILELRRILRDDVAARQPQEPAPR